MGKNCAGSDAAYKQIDPAGNMADILFTGDGPVPVRSLGPMRADARVGPTGDDRPFGEAHLLVRPA
jgi:hypothetical protein